MLNRVVPVGSKKVVSIQIDEVIVQRLDAFVTGTNHSRAWVIRRAINELIEREDERDRLTRQALESVATERTKSHKRVRHWAEVLGRGEKPV